MRTVADLKGQRFGSWTVVSYNHEKYKWDCICDCGTIRSISASTLINGVSTSCGCKRWVVSPGQRFGRLTVVRKTEGGHGWICRCDCGNEKVVEATSLKKGTTKSCGCLLSEVSRKKCLDRTKHGMTDTRLYRIWAGMKRRCYNPNDHTYRRYGNKGITVCEEWRTDFTKFCEWAMEAGYSDELTLDRIDNSKGYSPDNCRWANWQEQQNNRTNNRMIFYQGEYKTLRQWSNELDFDYKTAKRKFDSKGYSQESIGEIFEETKNAR